MEDLSDVRFCARTVRCHRRRDSFPLHARVRRSSSVVRVVSEQSARIFGAATVRIRAAQSHVYSGEQAQAQAARRRETRLGLGRSADADALGLASSRLYTRIHFCLFT